MYAIFFGIYVIWFSLQFSFSSVCSLVLDYFAGNAFVAGDIDHIDAARKVGAFFSTPALRLSLRPGGAHGVSWRWIGQCCPARSTGASPRRICRGER